MVDDDNSSDKEAVIKEIADDFCTSYDTVKIDVVGIPENEYQKRLDEAAAANKLPAVFESGNVNLPQDTVDISGVMRSASRLYDCYLLNDYIKNGDDKRAPLGYEIPMVFANTKNSNFAEQVLDKNSLQAISSNGIVVSDAATNVFTTVYGSSVASYVSADALNDFCNSKAGFLFDFSSSFFSVDKKLTGKYKIIKVDAKNVECRMTTFFSISKLSDDEVTVSKKLIEYMYCAKCQEALHLDGKTGAFPVNKVAMSSYIDVYPSLETIKDITDKIKVEEVK